MILLFLLSFELYRVVGTPTAEGSPRRRQRLEYLHWLEVVDGWVSARMLDLAFPPLAELGVPLQREPAAVFRHNAPLR